MTNKAPLSWTSKGKRQQFFSDPAIDHMAAITLSLASEFWSLRERVYVLESLAEQSGTFSKSVVEDYELNDAERTELDGLATGIHGAALVRPARRTRGRQGEERSAIATSGKSVNTPETETSKARACHRWRGLSAHFGSWSVRKV